MSDSTPAPTNAPALSAPGPELAGGLLSEGERRRILSAGRLKLTLTLLAIATLAAFSALTYVGVSRIFDWLTPSIARDLRHKTQRGALELARSAELAIAVGDADAIGAAGAYYVADPDVVALVVLDDQAKLLFTHGDRAAASEGLFAQSEGQAVDQGDAYAAWAVSEIEGAEIGRVVLQVSKKRLEAGMDLRRDILTSSAVFCLLALVSSLLFVNLHIGPILRVTSEALTRLERTTAQALEATRLKSQFLANMSHEIRTPMNGILGVLDLLRRTPLSARQQRHIQTIDGSARSLLTIVNDVLDFSKLEVGKLVLENAELELRQTLQDVVELLAPRAHAKGVELFQHVAADVPHSIEGDVDRLRQVLTNLVGNAIKFTDAGHVVIRVSVEREDADGVRLRFVVEDTGIGIAGEDHDKLFDVFSQVDGSLTRRHGGTGLGLAISRRLVEAMGGGIGFDSELGKGSRFWFTVQARVGQREVSDEDVAQQRAHVLLVVRDEAHRELLQELATRWGMRVECAAEVDEAMRCIEASADDAFDLVVVDSHVDVADDACRPLFHLCVGEGLPVVRLLATGQTGDGREKERRHLCLNKPVRVSELYNGIVALLSGQVPDAAALDAPAELDDGPGSERRSDRPLVLVVDDNEINRTVAVELLADLGYPSEVACNGAEAVELVRRHDFGVILMDCQMPVMDGFEATARIRALESPRAQVPIVALTAHAMVGDRDRVLRAGMDDYLAKPVRIRALGRVLARRARGEASTDAASEAGAPEAPAADAGHAHPMEGDAAAQWALDPRVRRSPRVIELFVEHAPVQLEDLRTAAARGDAGRVKDAAHKLKGSCLTMGATKLAELAARVERAAAQGGIESAPWGELSVGLRTVTELLMRERGQMEEEAPRD